MKNCVLILFLSVTGVTQLLAQPVLDQTHFSTVNQGYVYSTATDPTIDYSSTGGNYTWDYSYLTPTGQTGFVNRPLSQACQLSNLFFGPFAYAAYQASYFRIATDVPLDDITAQFPITFDEVSRFTKNSSAAINTVGYEFYISGQGVAAKSDTIETRYALPLEYGDSYESRGFTKLDLNPFYDAQWRQHRHRESSVDGFGTVITPWGTFSALRIHHRIEEVDSFYINYQGTDFWLPIPVPESHEYEWRSVDDLEPVMLINTSVILGDEYVTSVSYRDEYNGLGVEDNTIEVSVFPNPFVDEVTVKLSSVGQSWSLIDARGVVVKSGELAGDSVTLSLKDIAGGEYVLVVLAENGLTSARITKK